MPVIARDNAIISHVPSRKAVNDLGVGSFCKLSGENPRDGADQALMVLSLEVRKGKLPGRCSLDRSVGGLV